MFKQITAIFSRNTGTIIEYMLMFPFTVMGLLLMFGADILQLSVENQKHAGCSV